MSQPNVIEALRNVLDAWPKGAAFCEPGSTLHRLHEAAAALPPGPSVVVPVELVKDSADIIDRLRPLIGGPSVLDQAALIAALQLRALLTAQMPQKEEG